MLFLDEILEFRRSALEALRQPLEDGERHHRARARRVPPSPRARSSSPRPIRAPAATRATRRAAAAAPTSASAPTAHALSGPLLDRIDLHVALPPVDVASLSSRAAGESSAHAFASASRARAQHPTERSSAAKLARRLNAQLSLARRRAVRHAPTPPACGSSSAPSSDSASRRGPTARCSGSRAPSPTSTGRPRCARRTSPRRSKRRIFDRNLERRDLPHRSRSP